MLILLKVVYQIIIDNCDNDQSYSLRATDNEDSLQMNPLSQLDTTHTQISGDLKDDRSSNSSKAVSPKGVVALVISNNHCKDDETDNNDMQYS